MAHSDPVIRQSVLDALKESPVLSADTMGELRDLLGLSPDLPHSKLSKAVRSLAYNHANRTMIRLNRPPSGAGAYVRRRYQISRAEFCDCGKHDR